jgi:hypothetical protein
MRPAEALANFLLSFPSPLGVYTLLFFTVVFGLLRVGFRMVQLGHRVLDLLRDLRDFRDGY